jgi:hypothetical protein
VADWDANSPELRRNLQEVGRKVTADATARESLSSEAIRHWQDLIMRGLEEFDRAIRRDHFVEDLTADNINAVVILCAWAHGEWVRIHPFPNGNGRTSRILVNSIAQRYGLPAFMRVRPRPGDEYAWVASQAMVGDWQAAIPLFMRLYDEAL